MPLTERILATLPGPRWAWALAWALVALIRLGALIAILTASGVDVSREASVESALGQAILGYVILVSLVGSAALVRRVGELDGVLERIAPGRPAGSWFDRTTSTAGPIALTVVAVVVSVPSTLAEFGPAVAAADVVLLGLVSLPILTFVWAYGALLLGLDRLGRAELRLDDFPQDRALGLGPVGAVAMTGFWILVVAAAPLLVFAGSDLITLGTSVAVLAVSVGLFALSMVRLHGQMRAAKGRYVALARRLVTEAYGPVRLTTDVATLTAAKPGLDATLGLADRAEKLLEWPIDERMVTWITVVVTGVATSLVVRFVVETVGA